MIVPTRRAIGLPAARRPRIDGAAIRGVPPGRRAAVLRECIVNLARIKETVSRRTSAARSIPPRSTRPELMRGITAGLLMLGQDARGRGRGRHRGVHVKRVMQPGGALAASYLDRLADAIVSVEYYMETLQAGRSEPFYMLDNAQTLPRRQLAADARNPAVPTRAAALRDALLRARCASPAFRRRRRAVAGAYRVVMHARADGVTDLAATDAPGTSPPTLAAVPVSPPAAVLADPELVSLFIEEAGEEVAKISREYPRWDDNPLEDSALARTVRRSFHTLKGSGRMVGARRDGGVFLVDRKSPQSPHRQDADADAGDSGNAARSGVDRAATARAARRRGRGRDRRAAPVIARAHALAAGHAEDYVAETRIPVLASTPAAAPAAAAAAAPALATSAPVAAPETLLPAESVAEVAPTPATPPELASPSVPDLPGEADVPILAAVAAAPFAPVEALERFEAVPKRSRRHVRAGDGHRDRSSAPRLRAPDAAAPAPALRRADATTGCHRKRPRRRTPRRTRPMKPPKTPRCARFTCARRMRVSRVRAPHR